MNEDIRFYCILSKKTNKQKKSVSVSLLHLFLAVSRQRVAPQPISGLRLTLPRASSSLTADARFPPPPTEPSLVPPALHTDAADGQLRLPLHQQPAAHGGGAGAQEPAAGPAVHHQPVSAGSERELRYPQFPVASRE